MQLIASQRMNAWGAALGRLGIHGARQFQTLPQ